MSHLDTAFKLGAVQAEHDFNVELNKVAQGDPTAGAMAPIRSMLAGVQGPGGAAPAPAARPAPVAAKPAVQNVPPPRFGGAGGAAPGAAGPAAGGMQLQQPAMGGSRPAPGAGALSPGKLQLR